MDSPPPPKNGLMVPLFAPKKGDSKKKFHTMDSSKCLLKDFHEAAKRVCYICDKNEGNPQCSGCGFFICNACYLQITKEPVVISPDICSLCLGHLRWLEGKRPELDEFLARFR